MAENCGCKYDTMARVSQEPVDLSASLRFRVPAGCQDMTHGMGGLAAGCEDVTRGMPLQVHNFAESDLHNVPAGQTCTYDKLTMDSSVYVGTASDAGTSPPSFPASYVARTTGSEDAFPVDFEMVMEGGSEVLRPSSRLRVVDPRDPRRVHIVEENQRRSQTSFDIPRVR